MEKEKGWKGKKKEWVAELASLASSGLVLPPTWRGLVLN